MWYLQVFVFILISIIPTVERTRMLVKYKVILYLILTWWISNTRFFRFQCFRELKRSKITQNEVCLNRRLCTTHWLVSFIKLTYRKLLQTFTRITQTKFWETLSYIFLSMVNHAALLIYTDSTRCCFGILINGSSINL